MESPPVSKQSNPSHWLTEDHTRLIPVLSLVNGGPHKTHSSYVIGYQGTTQDSFQFYHWLTEDHTRLIPVLSMVNRGPHKTHSSFITG